MMERSGLQSLDEQVEMKKDQMRSDPSKRGVTNDLISAIANQQILKEQQVKAQALARSQSEPPGTIVEQTQNQVLQNKTAELTNNVAGVFKNKDARKKQNMQAMVNRPPPNMQGARPNPQNPTQRGMPNPQNMQGRGIPTQQRPMMVAQGGLIPKFQAGGRIEALRARIQKALRDLGPADPSDPARQQALKDILNVVTRGATAEEATAARNILINAGMDRPDAAAGGPDFGAANQAKMQGDLKNIEGSEGAANMAGALGLGAAELYATKRLGGAGLNMLGKSNAGKKVGKKVADKTKEVADKTKETVEKSKNPLRKLVTESKHRKKFPDAKVGKTETGRITKAGAADEARQFSGKRAAQTGATALGLTALAGRAAGSSDPQAKQDATVQQIRDDIATNRQLLDATGTGGPRVVTDMGGAGVLRKGQNVTPQGGAPTGGTGRPELETQATTVNTDPSITQKQLAAAPSKAVSGGLSDLNDMIKTGMKTDPAAIKTAAVTKGRLEQGLDKIDPKTGKQVSAEGSPLTLEGLENLQKERQDLLAEQQTEEGGARDARLARMYAARAGAAGKARGDSMLQAQQDERNLAGTKINDYVSRIQKKTAALKTINEQAGKEFELAQTKKLKNMEIYANLAAEDRKTFDAYLDRVAQGNRAQVNADVQMALGKDVNALKLEIQRTNQITTLTGLLSSFNKLSAAMEESKMADLARQGITAGNPQYDDAVAKIQAEVQFAYGPLIKSVTQRMMEFDAGGQGPTQRGSAFTGGAPQGGGSNTKQAPATSTQSNFLQQYSSPPTGGSGIMQLPSS
jgi:hypothetical protein